MSQYGATEKRRLREKIESGRKGSIAAAWLLDAQPQRIDAELEKEARALKKLPRLEKTKTSEEMKLNDLSRESARSGVAPSGARSAPFTYEPVS